MTQTDIQCQKYVRQNFLFVNLCHFCRKIPVPSVMVGIGASNCRYIRLSKSRHSLCIGIPLCVCAMCSKTRVYCWDGGISISFFILLRSNVPRVDVEIRIKIIYDMNNNKKKHPFTQQQEWAATFNRKRACVFVREAAWCWFSTWWGLIGWLLY